MPLRRTVWRIRRDRATRRRLETLGTLEGALRVVMAERAIDCVLDVGAHRGEYAQRLRTKVGFAGRIVSFEPGRESFDRLRDAMGADARWSGRQLALGDQVGNVTLHVFEDTMFSSVHTPSEYGAERYPMMRDGATEEVPLTRLDHALDDVAVVGSRCLLKIDTQGHDLAVYRGAVGILDRVQALQMELGAKRIYDAVPPLPEILATLAADGFETVGVFPIARDRDALRVLEFDGLFVRAPRA